MYKSFGTFAKHEGRLMKSAKRLYSETLEQHQNYFSVKGEYPEARSASLSSQDQVCSGIIPNQIQLQMHLFHSCIILLSTREHWI